MSLSPSPTSGISLRNSYFHNVFSRVDPTNDKEQADVCVVRGPLSGNLYRICNDKVLGEGTYGCVKLAELVSEEITSGGDCGGGGGGGGAIAKVQSSSGSSSDDDHKPSLSPWRESGNNGNGRGREVVAVKILDKRMIRALDLEDFVARERDIQLQLAYGSHGSKPLFQDRLHVTRTFDVVENHEQIMFFIEFYQQGSLQKVHFGDGFHDPAPESVVQRYMRELIHGSMELLHHRHNIVHRDIQLDNICLDESGHVTLIDFGMADQYNPDELVCQRPHIPLLAGNRAYMAPELLFYERIFDCNDIGEETAQDALDEDDEEADVAGAMSRLTVGELMQKQDLWSVGVCMFQLATGFLPFQRQTFQSIPQQGSRPWTRRELNKIIVDLFQLPDWFEDEPISSECKDLIRSLLTVDLHKRPTLAQVQLHPWLNGDKDLS